MEENTRVRSEGGRFQKIGGGFVDSSALAVRRSYPPAETVPPTDQVLGAPDLDGGGGGADEFSPVGVLDSEELSIQLLCTHS